MAAGPGGEGPSQWQSEQEAAQGRLRGSATCRCSVGQGSTPPLAPAPSKSHIRPRLSDQEAYLAPHPILPSPRRPARRPRRPPRPAPAPRAPHPRTLHAALTPARPPPQGVRPRPGQAPIRLGVPPNLISINAPRPLVGCSGAQPPPGPCLSLLHACPTPPDGGRRQRPCPGHARSARALAPSRLV